MDLLLIAAVLFVALVIALAISRANEMFYVSIRDGRCLIVRGHVPPSLYSELCAVVRISGAKRGTVRAVKEGGQPRLVTSGLDAGTTQRLRNAFGARGFGKGGSVAPASSTGTRNLGQLLGLAWLAWFLSRRD